MYGESVEEGCVKAGAFAELYGVSELADGWDAVGEGECCGVESEWGVVGGGE